MNKEHIENEINKIDIPQEELFASIGKGIEKGRKENRRKRKSTFKKFGVASSVAASAVLASGFIFAPVSNVLAAVPIIGSIYEKIGLQIGQELEEDKLLTVMNQVATDNGVQVTLTSAYFEGDVVGVSFTVEGKEITSETIKNTGPEAGYAVQLFNGTEQEQWSSTSTGLTETENGFTTGIEFYNSNTVLSETDNLPITFTSIAGVQGKWEFTVPLQQIPSETILVRGDSVAESEEYALTMATVTKGAATTLLSYDVTLPLNRENDEINLTVYDNEGNLLSKSHSHVLTEENGQGTTKRFIQEHFRSEISDTATHLIIQPEILKSEAGSKPIKMDSIRIELTN